MSSRTELTFVTRTQEGNLIFQADDDTVYVCREAMHGAEVWKSSHGKYLNTAGTLITNRAGFGFGLNKTACECCGHAYSCPECRCTDLELETDFQTSGTWGEFGKRVKDKVAEIAVAGAKKVGNAHEKTSDAVTKLVAAAQEAAAQRAAQRAAAAAANSDNATGSDPIASPDVGNLLVDISRYPSFSKI